MFSEEFSPEENSILSEAIFETTEFDFSVLKKSLRETAFLNKGIRIVLTDYRPEEPKTVEFHYEGGIRQFVEYLNKKKEPVTPDIIYFEAARDDCECEIAMQYTKSYNETILSYANNPGEIATKKFMMYHIQLPAFRKAHKTLESVKGDEFLT